MHRPPRRMTQLACLPSFLWLACQPAAGARVQADLNSFQRDQSADRLLARGRAFAAVGDTTRAEEYLAAALDAGGDEREILPALLSVCVRDGRYRLAITYAELGLRQRPDDQGLRLILATLYLALGEQEAAERELSQVLRAAHEDANAHYAYALLMRDYKANQVEASRHFREYLRLAPSGPYASEARAGVREEQAP